MAEELASEARPNTRPQTTGSCQKMFYGILVRSMTAELHHRRQYLVDRSYQLRFVTRLLVTVFIIAISSSFIAMAILWQNMYRPELDQQTYIVSAFIGVATFLLIELLISIPLVYYLGIRQSHRVVGPLKRITRALEALGSGDFSQRLTLRQGDVLENLAKSINRMAENLQKRYANPPQ